MKRFMTALAACALMLSIVVPAVGAAENTANGDTARVEKSAYGSYIVVMRDNPLLAAFDQAELNTSPARAERARLRDSHDRALRDAGLDTDRKINEYTNAANGFSARMSHAEAERLAASPDVLLVLPDELQQVATDNSPSFLGLDDRGGAWASGLTGENVVVGVVDTGIWPEHPSFEDDGTYGPAPASFVGAGCEFGNTAFNPDDAPFECNNKLLSAKKYNDTFASFLADNGGAFSAGSYDSARDEDGHGSHTAGTAAGNAGVQAEILGNDLGEISGIAPRARVSAYKACWSSTLGDGCFTSDLTAAIDTAVADGVDVINYSIGGGASVTGADDISFLFAADAGVFVATSNGNSGPGAGTVGGPASVPWITAVGASTQDRTYQGSASSSDGWEFFGASITGGTDELKLVDAADAGDELCNPGALDPAVVEGNVVLCLRGAIARVAKSQAVEIAGGAGMILYNASDAQSQVADNHYVPSVHINNTDGLVIKDYIAATGASAVAQINGGVFTEIDAPWMASFSSRGPNSAAGDIIKPDVTAPGVNVLAANTPTALLGAPGQYFQMISGTSMSSPHVAGLYALLKQAHRDWTPAMAKSAIMTTAYQDVKKEDGATRADPFDMGAGHIDPSGRTTARGSVFNPGIVYDAGFLDYLGFLCDAGPEVFGDPAGTCASLESLGIPTDASDLNLPSIGIDGLPGSQTVTRTVTSVANRTATWRARVEAPRGFTVDVSPAQITLAPGESASYEVTITAIDGVPLGEWRFGSLTWRSQGSAAAYSPIAVNASLFSAPDAVTGEGEDGSASFDVTFGYTGDYTAAAHGLESAILTEDTVVQDPDQTFDPTDGYSNPHVFTTSGAAYVRFAIPPEAVSDPAADLDIFLLDSAGNEVASSTNGATNEVIEVVLPPDDTWTLWVHGWAAGTGTDYTLYTWVVSATPGGNMTVDSAPASATIGATETVEVSWTGATAGEWHFGAVSHSDANGLIGLTLFEVDNR